MTESPLVAAGNQIVKGNGASSNNLPIVAKQNASVNDTRDTINPQENSRRNSQGAFSVKRPKMGEPDFDFSSLNLNLRLRELESKMIDMKGDMERRIQQIIEETPMKMMNQLRFIEEKETTMWADNLEKHSKNSTALVLQNNRVSNHMETLGNRLVNMQKQIEDMSFKNVELERNIANLTRHNRDLLDNNINALEVKQIAGRDRDDLLTEVKLLRDRLNHQEEHKNRAFKDLSAQLDSLNSIVLKNEKDLYDRLREQKKELLEEAIGSKGQFKKLEEMRMEKILGDNEYIKSLMDGLERKVKSEVAKRLNSDFDQKNWLEMQFHGFKDEIKSDQRDMLENQNNLVREVQESISSLNSIIKNTREEIMATTNSNQLLMTENMRNLTKALEIVKDNMMSRVGSLDNAMVDLNKRMELTNEAFNENTIKVTQAMETEFNRVDRVMNRFEDLMTESNKQLNDRISEGERKQQAWRSEYEDKNHNIFKEMSTALKSLKKQIMKVNKDSDDRDQELGKLIENAKKLADGMFKNLDEKANHLESIYNFKLDESTKVWEHNLQIEVDKVLDAISKNTVVVQTDFVKRIANLKLEVNKTMFDNVDKEVFNLRELVSETRRVIEDSTISKIKDIEVRLENLFRVRFDEYRIKLEDSIREFNRLKGEMEHIKKDYYNSLETVREDMKANTRREVETMKGQLVNRIKESKDQVDELMTSTVKLMKEDIDLNKLDTQRSVDAAKLHIQSELQTSVNDIKNMVDKNDQIIHADVNNKMNSLNTEISTQKKFLMERMDEMHESTKSLARALVAEEAANRANKDEMIIKLFDRKINNLNSFITSQVEQKLDELKIDLENKIKDALNGLEEFKRWTLDEFSKVRTEHEYFKQEYYARDYADHLMFLTFESQVRAAFDGCQNQFHEARRAIDNLKSDMEDANKQIKKNMEEEQKNREEADEKMDEKFEDYKKLNEKTWEEMLMMYQTDLYNLRLNLSIVEEAIYESIRRVIASLGSLGGASDDLLQKIEDINGVIDKHMDKTKKQDKTNADTFKEVKDTATKFREDYDGFKKVTKRNFEVTEESLSVLSHYMNSLDSQINIDQMMSLATFNLLEQRSAAGVAEVEGYMRIMNKDTVDNLEDKLKKQEKKIVEDIIPGQILKVNESLNLLGQKSNENTSKLTETLQKKITEHTLSIEKHDKDIIDHTKQLQEHAQRIKFAEENLTDAGQDFKKIERTIADTNAQVVVDAIAIQADINILKTGIVDTIKEIYSTLASMETGDKGEAEATASSMVKVTKRLDTIDKKMAELDKATAKYDDRIKKVEAAKDKGKDDALAMKADASASSKEIKDLKKEIEALVADVKELKAAGKGKDTDDEVASKKSAANSDLDKLPQQVAELQSQMKALEKKLAAMSNGKKDEDDDDDDNNDDDDNDGGDDDEEREKKSKKKGKKDKIKAKKDDDDKGDGEDSTKVTQGDLDDLESKIDEKLEKLKDELQDLIGGKDKNKSGEDDEEKSETNKKKKSKADEEDDEKSEDNEMADLKEKLDKLETRVAELEEKKNESGEDDEKDDKKKSGNDEDLDDKINEKVEEKIKEMRDDLKEEILNEIKEDKGEDSEKNEKDEDNDDDDEDDKGKKGGNSEIWIKINKIEEKFDEYDKVKLTVDRLQKDVEKLKDNDDDDDN